MYRGKKIIGIIPARNGSKGITHKNMVLLNNHPLIWWTIKSAKESSLLDEIVVSTDGAEIAEFAHNEGVSVIHRPAELASDTSPTIECIIHALQHYKSAGGGVNVLII